VGIAATLNGHRATRARVQVPAWGAWYCDVSLDGEHTLAAGSAATLVVADATFKGAVLSGGPYQGRSEYRLVGGKGGWGKTIPKKSYANDAGVKLGTVLTDAATAVGETLSLTSTETTTRVGPAWVRPEGPASRALELLSSQSWYVDEAGVTRLGKRASSPLAVKATRTAVDLARGTITLATDTIATIKPGTIVDGLEAVDVAYEVNADTGVRTTIWGKRGASSRAASSLLTLLNQLDPDRAYRGVWEYRVVTTSGKRLNLQPVRVSTGMPDLVRVPVMPGLSGCDADVKLGSRVLVGFIDSDPARPVVLSFEDAEGEGFVPTTITFAKGVLGVARMTDPVLAGPFAGTITSASTKVRCG